MSPAHIPRYINFSELDRWDVKYFSIKIKSKYPLIALATFVREHNEKVRPSNFPEETFKILGVNNTDGIFHAYDALGKEIKQPYKKVSAGDFAYNPYRINVGSIGWVPDEHDGAFISPAYVVFSIDENIILPELFWFILKSEFFNKTLRAATAGSVRMNLTYPLLGTLKIPVPPIHVQQKIVAYWEKIQKAVLKSNEEVSQITNTIQDGFISDLGLSGPKKTIPSKCFSTNWGKFDRWSVSYNQAVMSMIDLRKGKYPVVGLGSILELVQYGTSEKANITQNGTPVLRMNNIKDGALDYSDLKHVELSSKARKSLLLKDGDILFNRTNSKELVGKCAVFHSEDEYVFASYLIRVKVNPTKADPDFVVYTLNTVIGRQQIDAISRQIIGQANINSQELRSLNLPLPPLKVQQNIMKNVESGRAKIQQIKEASEKLQIEASSNIEKLILGNLSVENL